MSILCLELLKSLVIFSPYMPSFVPHEAVFIKSDSRRLVNAKYE
jgi:hypothetical protein